MVHDVSPFLKTAFCDQLGCFHLLRFTHIPVHFRTRLSSTTLIKKWRVVVAHFYRRIPPSSVLIQWTPHRKDIFLWETLYRYLLKTQHHAVIYLHKH